MTADDFLRPTGRLDPEWVDEESLDALITQAEAASDDEATQIAFVYARAYNRLADDWAARASTRSADDITEVHSATQIAHWRSQARAWEAEFDRLNGTFAAFTIVW